jgi:hypothetical protein
MNFLSLNMKTRQVILRRWREAKVNDCELISTCPYYTGMIDMPERWKEEYCRGEYGRCGRYMFWSALERERNFRFSPEMAGGETTRNVKTGGIP